MIISIASDHAGFEQKKELSKYLLSKGFEVCDVGPESDQRVDYPDFAAKVALEIQEGRADRGVLICGTGIGMAMAANRFRGVRAANVLNPEFAVLAREHNDANVVALSARFVEQSTNERILDAFLSTDFGQGRHAGRVTKIDTANERN